MHASHHRLRMALLILGTILSIAAPLITLYWGGCAQVTPPTTARGAT